MNEAGGPGHVEQASSNAAETEAEPGGLDGPADGSTPKGPGHWGKLEVTLVATALALVALLAAGLIDELRLVIAPVIVGNGRRLFSDGGAPAGLQLVGSESTPGGLTIQTYAYTGQPDYATYTGVSAIA